MENFLGDLSHIFCVHNAWIARNKTTQISTCVDVTDMHIKLYSIITDPTIKISSHYLIVLLPYVCKCISYGRYLMLGEHVCILVFNMT